MKHPFWSRVEDAPKRYIVLVDIFFLVAMDADKPFEKPVAFLHKPVVGLTSLTSEAWRGTLIISAQKKQRREKTFDITTLLGNRTPSVTF